VGGAAGAVAVIEILRRELAQAMALTGRTTIESVDSTVLWE
jgi:isopentenyl diphosphate isomerase/L-lactate dehydrogenase-like FMN-dependent dehydrogenase